MSINIKPRLKTEYISIYRDALLKECGLENINQVPNLEKIVINCGCGEATKDSKVIEKVSDELSKITGQKPRLNKSKKSIAQFKLREGFPVGMSVTLRGDRAWEFLDRLINLSLPRVRDFRGLKTKFDGHGNYTFGIVEQSIFYEINPNDIEAVRGYDITIVTTSDKDEHAKKFLEKFNFPFIKK